MLKLIRNYINPIGFAVYPTCEASRDLSQPYSEPPAQQPEPKRISTNQCAKMFVSEIMDQISIKTPNPKMSKMS
jgi:hypothetical protein